MWNEYTSIILRSVVVYLFIVIAIRLFGKKESCRIPTPEERTRFLN